MPLAELPPIDELARRLGGVVSGSNSCVCNCPIHENDGQQHTPSCIVRITKGRLIAHCRSKGCDKKDWKTFRPALAAKADIVLSLVGARKGTGPAGIRYDYWSPEGVYSWSKLRTETPTGRKSFSSGVWDETHGWTAWQRPVDAVPLYGLREVAAALAADPGATVLVVEGEKDVGTAQRLGLVATSAADGTKWTPLCTDVLVRLEVRRVCVVPDNDPAGIEHGIRVADALLEREIDVDWLVLPNLEPKEDLSDWVDRGGTRDQLDELLAKAPAYDPDLFQWLGRLVPAGGNSPSTYRGGTDTHNIGLVLQYHPDLRGAFRWNLFRQRVEITRDLPWKTLGEKRTPLGFRAREDSDITNLGAWLIGAIDFAPFNIDTIDRAMRSEAQKASFDEAVVWLERIPAWDRVPRIDTFLQRYFMARLDADDPERSAAYLAMVGYMLFAQVVRRIHDPGCQADHSLMLYGNQGDGKDKALRSLFGPYLSESPPSLKIDRAADRARTMGGYLMIHDAELASFGKAGHNERKAALSRSHDKGRAAFARELDDYPRRAPWCFSGNIRGILSDPTGDRRMWPMEVEREITDELAAEIRRDAPQLWAEAKARVAQGEADWPDTVERKELLAWGQATFRPESFGDLERELDHYIAEEPLWSKPAPGDSLARGWLWRPRNAPLTALTVGRFFSRTFGEVVGVGGGRHADRKHVTVVTVYLQRKGWTIGKVRAADVIADEDERRYTRAWRAPDRTAEDAGSRLQGRGDGPDGPGNPPVEPPVTAPSKASRRKPKSSAKTTLQPSNTQKSPVNKASNPDVEVAGSTNKKGVILKRGIGISDKSKSSLMPLFQESTLQPCDQVEAELFTAPVGGSKLTELALVAVPCPDGIGAALAALYRGAETLAIDVETTGLNATTDRIRTVQFCDGATVSVVVWSRPLPAREALEPLQEVLRGSRLIAHPARFEGAWLHAAGLGDLVLDDTALLWAAIHGGGNRWKKTGDAFSPISLADLARATIGIELDKTEQLSDWSAETLSLSQLRYAALDAVVTALIWEALLGQAGDRSMRSDLDLASGYDDLRKSNALALQMERAGVAFDLVAHKAWTDSAALAAAPSLARIKELEPMVETSSPHQLGIAVDRRLATLDGRSARLSRRYWPRTEKGNALSFSKKSLASVLAAGYLTGELRDLVQALHDLKDLTGRLTLFGEGFARHVGADGRLRGSFFAAGAVTGRYVSQAPNLQNIFEEFRTYLVAPPGRVLICADYSQLELRVLAAIARCPGMTAAFARGDDYHDKVSRDAGISRIQAKRINFGVVYGQGVDGLARELQVSQGEAAEYLERWAKGAPGAWRFLEEAPGRYASEGGIATVRRWIDAVDDADASSKAGTRPRNYPIQGAAGDVLHRAMALLLDQIPAWPGKVLPLLTIHDEIVLEADADAAAGLVRLLPEVLTNAFTDILPDAPTLHLVFGGVGTTWLEAKKNGGIREKAARAKTVL